MNISIGLIIIVAATFFVAAVIDSVCGGGGLITVPVLMLSGVPVHMVAGTNQCSFTVGFITGAARYAKAGKVSWFSALIAGALGLVGGVLGAKLNMIMDEQVLRIIMIVLVPVMAVVMLVKKDFGAEDRSRELSRRRQAAVAVLIGLLLGTYQGFYAVGCGTLTILAFTALGKYDLVTASGNTRIFCVFANLSCVVTYALSGAIVWEIVVIGVIFGTLGSYIGSGLAIKKGAKLIRPMFIFVLVLIIIKLVSSLF